MMDFEQEYYLDIKAILEFINYSDNHTNKETEIIDKYEKDENKTFNAAEKTIREITTYGNVNMDNINYDLIKMLLGQVLSWGYETTDETNVPFGLQIAFNTLLKEKLLLKNNK